MPTLSVAVGGVHVTGSSTAVSDSSAFFTLSGMLVIFGASSSNSCKNKDKLIDTIWSLACHLDR